MLFVIGDATYINIISFFTASYVVILSVNVFQFSFIFDRTLLSLVDVKPVISAANER